MFENLDIFKMSSAMAVHAGQKQAVISMNVANADTPGYRSQDVPGFSASYRAQAGTADASQLRTTRARHLTASSQGAMTIAVTDRSGEASPDGNTVSLETEMRKSIDAKRQHDRALAIYKSALSTLRSSLGR
ncbi:FlgB family protein [Sulfitobacter sabulilitoris]|uniref:FlgB family protein n=1 Tax=Sulfitobacter sabulilitoris TaxID=2562655 RepID=A0A5S3PGS4_9RHOB|nr:FlgB family protein [Sulfitobacter sabulilitoris]TMM52511.1 FlgB family protein [Sulfitobacter sabulilitoris]